MAQLNRDTRPQRRSFAASMRALEPRIMFDAAVAPTLADMAAEVSQPIGIANTHDALAPVTPNLAGHRAVVFVDNAVRNYQQLVGSIAPEAEIVLLDHTQDGLGQMSAYLAGRQGFDAIHVISHGNSGTLYLGTTRLDNSTLNQHTAALTTIGQALTAQGDLLLYGCDVAANESGATFVNQLSTLTGADIAASTDRTGTLHLGGDWILEARTGTIEALSVLSADGARAYNDLLALPSANQSFSTTYYNNNRGANTVDGFTITAGASTTILTTSTSIYINGTNVSGGNKFGTIVWTADNTDLATFDLDTLTVTNLGGNFQIEVSATSGGNPVTQTANILTGSGTTAIDIDATQFNDISSFTIKVTNTSGASTQNIDLVSMVLADLKAPVSNNAPVNTVPSAQTFNEDGSKTFSSGGSNAISVSDADGDNLTVTLSATGVSGSLVLATTAGLTMIDGDGSDGTLSFSGAAANINTAMNGLVYTPTANANGAATLQIVTSDGVASDTDTVAMTVTAVNDVPTDIGLSASSVNQSGGTNATVGTLSATDIDSASFTYTLVSGVGDTDNASFNISGSTLRANNAAVMSAGVYSIRVRVDDGASGTYEEVMSITVVDNVAPTVTSSSSASAANASSATYTVVFSESVTGVDLSDFTLTTTGTAAGTLASISGSGTTYTITVNGISGSGTMAVDLNGAGTSIIDANGNAIGGGFSGTARTVDLDAPTVNASSSASAANASSATYTVVFSESVTGVDLSDFTLTTTGTAAGTLASISGSGTTYTITVNGISGSGTMAVDLNGAGTSIIDANGNAIGGG
ncbi:DUF4347 domain-containing protein, partial [Chitinivorax sp. B]|uniref:DUF4347 domain-containing protein n=1 Tax=Chitinivorax sp. B TaxID=2502235 RepID=UPI0010F4B744